MNHIKNWWICDRLIWFCWSIALRTDPKNRTSHGRPPARLRQTLTFVLKIREEKRPKTEWNCWFVLVLSLLQIVLKAICCNIEMVSTKHCCWGKCRSDSRYPEKLAKLLQEMIAAGLKAFIPFPKPSQGLEKCQRWILACSREYFTVENITRNTYICALHWPGEKGPTDEFPDPLKANFTKKEKEKASSRKRRSPLARSRTLPGSVPQKRQKLISDEDSFSQSKKSWTHLPQKLNLKEK